LHQHRKPVDLQRKPVDLQETRYYVVVVIVDIVDIVVVAGSEPAILRVLAKKEAAGCHKPSRHSAL